MAIKTICIKYKLFNGIDVNYAGKNLDGLKNAFKDSVDEYIDYCMGVNMDYGEGFKWGRLNIPPKHIEIMRH